jgi:hypothetical protein
MRKVLFALLLVLTACWEKDDKQAATPSQQPKEWSAAGETMAFAGNLTDLPRTSLDFRVAIAHRGRPDVEKRGGAVQIMNGQLLWYGATFSPDRQSKVFSGDMTQFNTPTLTCIGFQDRPFAEDGLVGANLCKARKDTHVSSTLVDKKTMLIAYHKGEMFAVINYDGYDYVYDITAVENRKR